MRPVGDVRQALLSAATALVTPDRGPTLREMAQKACVGDDAAMHTVKNMCRSGQLTKVRERRVPYRNRPVAEYAPAAPADFNPAEPGWNALAGCLSGWR